MGMMKFAVLGDPIVHSKSPAIHTAAYRVLGLDWQYERFQVTSNELEDFLDARLTEFAGFSATMPLKERLYEIAVARDWVRDKASATLLSSNTLFRESGALAVANTDLIGAARAIEEFADQVISVAILGSGATAKSTALAAVSTAKNSQELMLFSRRSEPAEGIFEVIASAKPGIKCSWLPIEAAADFGGADLTINTIPGLAGIELEVDQKFGKSWVFDVTYNPWPSTLASQWPQDSRVSGLEMLVQQAIEQLKLFGAISSETDASLIHEVASQMRKAALAG
jgi:shikimate dehydrogenase